MSFEEQVRERAYFIWEKTRCEDREKNYFQALNDIISIKKKLCHACQEEGEVYSRMCICDRCRNGPGYIPCDCWRVLHER